MVGLICCGKSKKSYACPARELYKGNLPIMSRNYCEKLGYDYYYLSAKYGILHKAMCIEPYDVTIQDLSESQLTEWRRLVSEQIFRLIPRKETILFMGSTNYRFCLDYVFDVHRMQDLFSQWRSGTYGARGSIELELSRVINS